MKLLILILCLLTTPVYAEDLVGCIMENVINAVNPMQVTKAMLEDWNKHAIEPWIYKACKNCDEYDRPRLTWDEIYEPKWNIRLGKYTLEVLKADNPDKPIEEILKLYGFNDSQVEKISECVKR